MPIENNRAFIGIADGIANKHEQTVIPQSLYHYTTSDGLLGIVSNDCIRFSDAVYLNDGSEVFYAYRLFNDRLGALMEGKPENELAFAELVRTEVQRNAEAFRAAIFCTSEAPNLLNQWRDYGPGVVAYQLELDPAGMLMRADKSNFGFSLFRMIYDEQKHKVIMDEVLAALRAKCLELVEAGEIDGDEANVQMAIMVSIQIVWLMYRLKNPAFRAEQEWRFAANIADIPDTARKFRTGPLGVVPYYSWEKADKEGPLLPVRSVMVGPSPHAPISDLALKEFLKASGHTVPTFYSTIPLRR